jgi:hypothetical protein
MNFWVALSHKEMDKIQDTFAQKEGQVKVKPFALNKHLIAM